MSASAVSKKQCVTCNKSGGVLTCDGCQRSFCGKHVIEHRQELAGQLDNIMQEHDLLQQEFLQPSSKKDSLLKKIDKWEKDSVEKIQVAAETARKALEEMLQQAKQEFTTKFPIIVETLRASREADDFSEHDLDRWRQQLKELTTEMKSSSIASFVADKNEPIFLRKLQKTGSTPQAPETTTNSACPSSASTASSTFSTKPRLQVGFAEILGPVLIEDGGLCAKHMGLTTSDYAYVRGRLLYSGGCHTMRFKLEKFKKQYQIFFGCMSNKVDLQISAFRSSSAVGWFGHNQTYEHGSCVSDCKKHGYNSSKMEINDIVRLTFDCDRRVIQLFHERLKLTHTLKVNIGKTPYPWQVLVVLSHSGDCVKVLNDS
ncbi:unnamed protein product [Adineta ricciae]|uniref:B box-type domain-containing protein n=1 Tax=Adineta ricciae TaxID=249248 RepID=A0A813QBC8_ADIRI|nr:unnamed protein product [Adineta ricciae]CAF1071882.1 unnamed protein product [Adineta ricciae]